jgi:DNA-binding response OmpR family regulator
MFRRSSETQRQPESITVLIVTPSAADATALKAISARAGWELLIAQSLDDASGILDAIAAPIILCDRDLLGGDWRSGLSRLAAHHGSVILASTVVDDYLLEEVIQQGGFDVLPKPFREPEVVRTVAFAWTHYRSTR